MAASFMGVEQRRDHDDTRVSAKRIQFGETTEGGCRKVWEQGCYALKDSDGIPGPEVIADAFWQVHCRHRGAWCLELDLRFWMERWWPRDCGLRSTLRIPPITFASAPTRFPK
jgi:hypothetical protein